MIDNLNPNRSRVMSIRLFGKATRYYFVWLIVSIIFGCGITLVALPRVTSVFSVLTEIAQRNTCTTCKGTGNGPLKCVHCKGSGKNNSFQCSFCKGTGWQRCGQCGGSGSRISGATSSNAVSCSQCKGTGNGPFQCVHCKGSGRNGSFQGSNPVSWWITAAC